MGIKPIALPKELLNLPQPYGETDFLRRQKQLKMLSYGTNEIKVALNVLERCLYSLSILTPPFDTEHAIPDSLTEYWSFTARWLADEIPTLDQFQLSKVEAKLKEYGIQSSTPTLTVDLANYWLWSVVFDIADSALYWLQRALMKTREQALISHFLYLAECYWQKMSPDLASSLLSRSAMIGWQKALPLFESVEQNPSASEEIIETVQDYRDLILDNPHKWLPDSETWQESPTTESEHKKPQRITQPPLKWAFALTP